MFINEDVVGQDKAEFDLGMYRSPINNAPIAAWRWTIDRDRGMRLISLGGGGLDAPQFYLFVVKDEKIILPVSIKSSGDKKIGITMHWNIQRFSIPDIWKNNIEELKHRIVEAVEVCGIYHDNSRIAGVEVSFSNCAKEVRN